jgi:hypothetical protein
MSGGGTNTVTNNSAPPPQVLNAYTNATAQAQQVSQIPFSQPQAPVAGLNAQQIQGINEVNEAQNAADPFINQADTYIGQSNAPLNAGLPYENTASGYANQASQYNPTAVLGQYTNPATGLYQQSVQNGINPLYVGSSQVNPTQFSAGQVNQYESPYTQQVVGATQAEFNNENAQQQQGVVGNAISAGAWGGDRSAVAQGITAGQQQLAEAPVIAGLENQGYSQALGEFNTQQQTGLQAQEANQQTNLQGQLANQQANLTGQEATAGLQQSAAAGLTGIGGLTAQEQTAEQQGALGIANADLGIGQQALGAQEAQGWLASQGAFASANLGNEALSTELSGANAEIGAGTLEQTQQQTELNAPYEQELAEEAYPFQTSQFLTNSVEGLGAGQGGTSSTTSPGASVGSQVAGVGLTGLATAGLLSQSGLLAGAGATTGFGAITGAGAAGAGLGAAAATDAAVDTGAFDAASGAADAGAAALLAARGGKIPRRAPGGGIAGLGQGIPGIVSVVPPSTDGGGRGGNTIPHPPQAPQQQQQMGNQAVQDMALLRGISGSPASGSSPSGASGGIDTGTFSDARGGPIPRRGIGGMMPHIGGMPKIGGAPKMPGGIGGHVFHPPGLHLAPGGGINVAQPDQTSQEVQLENAGQDEANAMAVAMASAGSGIPPIMNMPSSQARGGGIGYAGGGAVDSGSWDDSPVTITGSPSAPPPTGGGIAGPPPAPQQDAVQTSVAPPTHGGGSGSGAGGNRPPNNTDIWQTMLAAGLGIMGGTSPSAGVNIGRGGLEGLQFGENLKNREENVALRQTQQEQNNIYRQQMADVANRRADTGANAVEMRHEDRQDSLTQGMTIAQMKMATAAEHAANAAGKDHWTYTGTDENGNALLLSQNTGQIKTTDTHIGLKSTDQAKLDQGNAKMGMAQQYQQWKMQHGDATAAETADWHANLRQQGYTNEDIKLLEGSKDITGNPTMTPAQAHTAAQRLRQSNGAGAPPAGIAPVAPTAPSAPGSKPSLSSILGE